jgi:ribosomal protein S11
LANTFFMYIIDISFSKKNTLIHVMDFSGNLKFFCSAGFLNYKGKSKKSRYSVLKIYINI